MAYSFIPIVVLVLVFGAYVFAQLPPKTITLNTITTTSSSQTSSQTCSSGVLPCLHINEGGSFYASVEYFYYNQNTTMSFNFANGSQIDILSNRNAASSFEVVASVNSVVFGGKDNLSEGTIVDYTITPLKGIQGTYGLGFGWIYPSMEACGGEYSLAIGNGLPNYSSPYGYGCTAPLSNSYPVDSHGFVEGFLFAEIIDVSN